MKYFLATPTTVATLLGLVASTSLYPPTVHTSTGGAIVGHGASNKSSVAEFLGIRYAEAPVGELRFAAPKKYIAPAGTAFDASEWVRHTWDETSDFTYQEF